MAKLNRISERIIVIAARSSTGTTKNRKYEIPIPPSKIY
jgi:hypothetical protein